MVLCHDSGRLRLRLQLRLCTPAWKFPQYGVTGLSAAAVSGSEWAPTLGVTDLCTAEVPGHHLLCDPMPGNLLDLVLLACVMLQFPTIIVSYCSLLFLVRCYVLLQFPLLQYHCIFYFV